LVVICYCSIMRTLLSQLVSESVERKTPKLMLRRSDLLVLFARYLLADEFHLFCLLFLFCSGCMFHVLCSTIWRNKINCHLSKSINKTSMKTKNSSQQCGNRPVCCCSKTPVAKILAIIGDCWCHRQYSRHVFYVGLLYWFMASIYITNLYGQLF